MHIKIHIRAMLQNIKFYYYDDCVHNNDIIDGIIFMKIHDSFVMTDVYIQNEYIVIM